MANSDALDLDQAPESGKVRLEYTGDNLGSTWFTHPTSQVEYRGGINSADKYQDVPASDAAYLISLGLFRPMSFYPDGTLKTDATEKARLKQQLADAKAAEAEQAKIEAAALKQAQADLDAQEAEQAAVTVADAQASLDAQAEAEAQAKADASKTKK